MQVNEYDCLLLEFVFGNRPDDAQKVRAYVLETIASDPGLQQTELVFLGLFGRSCRILENKDQQVSFWQAECDSSAKGDWLLIQSQQAVILQQSTMIAPTKSHHSTLQISTPRHLHPLFCTRVSLGHREVKSLDMFVARFLCCTCCFDRAAVPHW